MEEVEPYANLSSKGVADLKDILTTAAAQLCQRYEEVDAKISEIKENLESTCVQIIMHVRDVFDVHIDQSRLLCAVDLLPKERCSDSVQKNETQIEAGIGELQTDVDIVKSLAELKQQIDQLYPKIRDLAEDYDKLLSKERAQLQAFIAEKDHSKIALLTKFDEVMEDHRTQLVNLSQHLRLLRAFIEQQNNFTRNELLFKLDLVIADCQKQICVNDVLMRESKAQIAEEFRRLTRENDQLKTQNRYLLKKSNDLRKHYDRASSNMQPSNTTKRRMLVESESGRRFSSDLKELAVEESHLSDHPKRIQELFKPLKESLHGRKVAIKLYEYNVLSKGQLEYIKNCKTLCEGAGYLMEIIMQSKRCVYVLFLEALRQTEQLHIYDALVTSCEINESHTRKVRRCFSFLVEKLNLERFEIGELFSKGVLDSSERDTLLAVHSPNDRNLEFLLMLDRKSSDTFSVFLDTMETKQINQGHVVKELRSSVNSPTYQEENLLLQENEQGNERNLQGSQPGEVVMAEVEEQEQSNGHNVQESQTAVLVMEEVDEQEQSDEHNLQGSQSGELVLDEVEEKVQGIEHISLGPVYIEREEQQQSAEQTDEFASFVRQNEHNLVRIINTENGLLDGLQTCYVLTPASISLILGRETNQGRVEQLLTEISMKSHSLENSEELMEALFNAFDNSQHKHVSNFIRGKGQRAAEYGDDWPLIYCAREFTEMQKNVSELIELIDPRSGLLDEMLAAGSIDWRLWNEVQAIVADKEANVKLLHNIQTGSLATYNVFIRCLLETKQHQIVSLLAPEFVGDRLPLSDYQQSRIRRNYSTLVRFVDTRNGLTAEMYAADCITLRQKEYIELTWRDSNKRLIDIVRRGSQTDYYKFIDCLNITGQHHMSRILSEDGAVAHIVATVSPVINMSRQERQIVDQLKTLLRDKYTQRIGGLSKIAQNIIDLLRQNEIALLTAEIEHGSIELLYFSTSLRGLEYLYKLYSNGRLKALMQKIFIKILEVHSYAVLDVVVDTLQWDLWNYTDCLQQLCTFSNLPIFSHVYEMAKYNQQINANCDDVRSLPIDQFPFELFEMILIRATGHLFVTINRKTPRAEIYTLATMTAVSNLWWVTLRYRKYIKRLLKRSFKRACHPFKCSPQQVTSLHIEGGNNVMGVAVLNDELFVACFGSNKIQVFDSRPPFGRQEDIQVQGLDRASDITVCNKSSSLFIADSGTECAIWRVNLLATKETFKFLAMQWQPYSISVANSRLLITARQSDSLYLYGDDGNELHRIELPIYMNALHAVETTFKTYIVSYQNKDSRLEGSSVAEVDVNGRVVRSLNDSYFEIDITCAWPRYLVLDNNHLMIADTLNDRILLLKSNLQLKRILINSLHGERPTRLCLTSSRLLAVSYLHSSDVDIYQV